MRHRNIAIIPARGGSKSIPLKNIARLAGQPLVYFTIDAAVGSGVYDKVAVSSDNEEILALSAKLDVELIKRPTEISGDNEKVSQSIFHVINSLRLLDNDVITLMQPTSPLRTSKNVREALEIYEKSKLPVVSIEDTKLYPQKYFWIDDNKIYCDEVEDATCSRQVLKAFYKPNGAIYIFSVSDFKRYGDVPLNGALPYFMNKYESIDIDSEEDLYLCKCILERDHD